MGQSKPYTARELARLRSGPFGRLRAILDEALAKKKAEIEGTRRADPSPSEPSAMWCLMGSAGEFTMSLLDEDDEPVEETEREYQPWSRPLRSFKH
jgi:hypothetical protein